MTWKWPSSVTCHLVLWVEMNHFEVCECVFLHPHLLFTELPFRTVRLDVNVLFRVPTYPCWSSCDLISWNYRDIRIPSTPPEVSWTRCHMTRLNAQGFTAPYSWDLDVWCYTRSYGLMMKDSRMWLHRFYNGPIEMVMFLLTQDHYPALYSIRNLVEQMAVHSDKWHNPNLLVHEVPNGRCCDNAYFNRLFNNMCCCTSFNGRWQKWNSPQFLRQNLSSV